ncbi:MAG: sensor histidine kinase, partial [bacterium]
GGNEDIKEFTQIVIDEINRLEKHLNEFMSFSRGVKLRLKKQDVHSFVTGVVMLVKHNFENTINIKVRNSGIPEVYMDQEQMRQVLVNLLNNAKEAHDGGGKPEAEVVISSDSSWVMVEVRDNGRGVPEEDSERVFNPFYTTKKEGLGIGLSISRTIMRRHGGEIYIKNTKDKGSSFVLKLPVEKRDAES